MEGHKNQRMVKILLITMPISVTTVLIMNLAGSKYLHLNPGKKFGIVLDAASTYTSIYLYHWPMNKMNGTGVVSQLYKCDVDEGISSFANDPAKAGQSLRPCLDKMLKYIPPKEFQETNIYLGATDGMRLLELQNRSQSRIILDVVQKTIQSYPFHFCEAWILTGAQEGAFGWITVNYLLKSFLQYSWEGIWIHPEPIQTYGLLDLGSLSTQLTFIPNNVFRNMPAKMNIHLYGYNYTIYTQSYPCYGQQQSIRKYIATLLKGKDLNTRIENPCYLKGYETMLTLDSIFGNPCTSTQKPSPYNGTQNFTVFGSGEPAKCSQGLKAIFNFTACGRSTTCSFDRVYQPAIHGNFYATSEFFHVFQFLNLTLMRPSLYKTKRTIEEFCTRNWIEIGQTDIGWTLGYMLNHTNMISSKPPEKIKTQSNTVWSSVSSLLGLTTLLSVLLNAIHFKQKDESKIQPLAGKLDCGY
ncbi:ectonucleoside triphosphate diphosphohydrolase 8-like isoform X2 [Chiloscyllium plagiosum]|uniref:ectonucleoside triphosphate diphosphohydrolase 8-like isoform X2 n=1 Tax=Chiloscyllium plagiosum TaxID=36176 RepID=UPI001CB83C49|nr:ectonucleoside triphosphate diphosphohydrolase 8-like isoform X2 [Chiloscyllium plagiosum]